MTSTINQLNISLLAAEKPTIIGDRAEYKPPNINHIA
jgi:hypothetical protein